MLKICYLDISGETGKFLFPNVNSSMINNILSYKSWDFFDSWSSNSAEKITYLKITDNKNGVLIETKDGIGFVPILLIHLKKLGFTILDIKGQPFDLYKNCTKVRFPMFRFNMRNYQTNCCLKWLRDGMGIIKSPTGSGKTIMASFLMKNIGYKTLVLVHTLDLVNMWKYSLSKTFGLSFSDTVGIFGGGRKLHDVINKNVIIGTYQSSLKEKNMKELQKAGFGLACFDECHHTPCDTFKKVVNSLLIPYKLGLSATPRRLDGKDNEIFALVDSIKASVSIHSLIKDGFVVRPDFYNISWIDNDIVKQVENSGKTGLQKSLMLKKLSASSNIKLSLLVRLIDKLRIENKTFLLFADFVDSASNINYIINELITKNHRNFKVTSVTQKMKSDEREAMFNSVGKKHMGLIFAKLGSEGIDIANVDCIIMMSPSKSPVTFSQRTGRAVRPNRGKTHAEIYRFVLQNSMEEEWKDYSFDEFRQENFIQKNYVIR